LLSLSLFFNIFPNKMPYYFVAASLIPSIPWAGISPRPRSFRGTKLQNKNFSAVAVCH
jgi:hypothetical protein